ncbi:hypothetical protein CP533_0373 [Ophiocordyceps camponoti-saundersi (nom. inval.)]|nr:hypothetical protein CP533_0373 [Ophiocordyceps camponoti-saundersi (nom. inval.)]
MARGGGFASLAGYATYMHIALAILLVIELGLTAFIVSRTSDYGTPSSFSFMLFTTLWSMLVLAYISLTPRYMARAFHALAALVLVGLTTLFWFAGSIALASFIGIPVCRGTYCTTTHSAQAATAFGFFIWAIFAVLAALDGMANLRGGGARADTTGKPAAQVHVAA